MVPKFLGIHVFFRTCAIHFWKSLVVVEGLWRPFVSTLCHLQHYSGSTQFTGIQLYLWVHRQFWCNKISSMAVKSYKNLLFYHFVMPWPKNGGHVLISLLSAWRSHQCESRNFSMYGQYNLISEWVQKSKGLVQWFFR